MKKQSWHLLTVLVVASAGLIQIFEISNQPFHFSIQNMLAGKIWVVLTHAFFHLGLSHYVYDALGMLLVGYFVETQTGWRLYSQLLAFSAMGSCLGFAMSHPMGWLVGMSGMYHGVIAGLICLNWKNHVFALSLSSFFILKILGEALGFSTAALLTGVSGRTVDASSAWAAHAGGLVFGFLFMYFRVLRLKD